MKPKLSPYTGTALSQKQERILVRERYASLVARRGLPRHVTFREINSASAKERKA